MRLIVGLGNPGKEYARTRHNMGFAVLDALAKTIEGTRHWKEQSEFRAHTLRGKFSCCEDVLLAKPQTFMNASGQAVAALAHYYRLHAGDIVLVHDELALPFGTLRLSHDASAANHNGVQSVIDALGSQAFWRLRVGIGPQHGKSKEYVLGHWNAEESRELASIAARAAEAIAYMMEHGPSAAQNKFH